MMACQRTTNTVCFICLNEYGHIAINYIDDFGAAAPPDQAQGAFSKLKELLTELGLKDSPDKESKPMTHMILLGHIYDTIAMTVSMPDDKLNEISSLVDIWLSKSTATITELQLLIGELYICSCIHPGHIFMQHLLNVLRSNYHFTSFEVPKELCRDLSWWSTFLKHYNGVSLLPQPFWVTDPLDFSVDVCDTGCGGFYFGSYFRIELSNAFLHTLKHIISKVLLAVLLACIIWKDQFTRKRLVINLDNSTVVAEINHGHSKNELRQCMLLEIWVISAMYNFELKALHVPSEANFISDRISCWQLGPSYQQEFFELAYTRYSEITECFYDINDSSCTSPW